VSRAEEEVEWRTLLARPHGRPDGQLSSQPRVLFCRLLRIAHFKFCGDLLGHVFGKGSLPIFVGCCSPEPPEPPPGRKIYKKLRRVPRPTTADVAISMDTDEVPSARGEADLGVGGDPPR
jgi:hypothetical protein